MLLVGARGSGWFGCSVVAEICYHDCSRVISGCATTGPSLRDRHPGCPASAGTPTHQEGHTRWTAIIPDGDEGDRRRRRTGAALTEILSRCVRLTTRSDGPKLALPYPTVCCLDAERSPP